MKQHHQPITPWWFQFISGLERVDLRLQEDRVNTLPFVQLGEVPKTDLCAVSFLNPYFDDTWFCGAATAIRNNATCLGAAPGWSSAMIFRSQPAILLGLWISPTEFEGCHQAVTR